MTEQTDRERAIHIATYHKDIRRLEAEIELGFSLVRHYERKEALNTAADEIERLEKAFEATSKRSDKYLEQGVALEAERDEWKESNRLSAADAVANANERDRLREALVSTHELICPVPPPLSGGNFEYCINHEQIMQALAEAKQ